MFKLKKIFQCDFESARSSTDKNREKKLSTQLNNTKFKIEMLCTFQSDKVAGSLLINLKNIRADTFNNILFNVCGTIVNIANKSQLIKNNEQSKVDSRHIGFSLLYWNVANRCE